MLDHAALEGRYARHHALAEIGLAGQQRLGQARVLVVGAGGLGAPVLLYLAAAGVGHIGIADDDEVSLSNLQRQVLHSTEYLGHPKTDSARKRLTQLNPEISIETYQLRMGDTEANQLLPHYDLVMDCTDNLTARYVLNHACVKTGVPLLSGAIASWEGQVGLYDPWRGGPCFACVFPETPQEPPAQGKGVVGALPGIVGATLAMAALKHITGAGASLRSRLLLIDTLWNEQRILSTAKDPNCSVCGKKETGHADAL